MEFFAKVGAGVAFAWSAKDMFARLSECAPIVENGQNLEDSLELSRRFAKAAHSAEKLVGKAGRFALLAEGQKERQAVEASVRSAMGSLRLLAAYHYHVGVGEPLGDFVIEQALELEKQWRSSQERLASQSQSALGRWGSQFDLLACSSVPVGLRGLAEKLSAKGELGEEQAVDLAERIKEMGSHHAAILRSDAQKKIKSISYSGEQGAQEKINAVKKTLAGSLGAAVEESQVYFSAGMLAMAMAPIKEALALATEQERVWARESLDKELSVPIKGNGARFCSWAKEAFKEVAAEPAAAKM